VVEKKTDKDMAIKYCVFSFTFFYLLRIPITYRSLTFVGKVTP